MRRRRLGALIFPGFEMLDLYGPLEMFAMRPDAFEIVTLAKRTGPVVAAGGPATVADMAICASPPLDVLLVPGGPGTRDALGDAALIGWLRETAAHAEIVASVCTGAALLAAAELLDGGPATTNKRAFDWVAGTRPDVDWRKRARWVEAGPIFTASGVSAGMDMALAMIARLMGRDAAEDAAHEAEYIWNHDPREDPFAKE